MTKQKEIALNNALDRIFDIRFGAARLKAAMNLEADLGALYP